MASSVGTSESGRLHRGRTVEERRAVRRARLLDAALELFGSQGYSATTIAEVCALSGVTSRYFYEEFGDRDEMLVALYDRELGRCTDQVFAAAVLGSLTDVSTDAEVEVIITGRLRAFVNAVLDDPRVARVLLLETGNRSSALERRRRDTHRQMAAFIAGVFDPTRSVERNWRIVTLSLVGAIVEVLADFTLSGVADRPSREEVIDHLAEIILAVRVAYFRSA